MKFIKLICILLFLFLINNCKKSSHFPYFLILDAYSIENQKIIDDIFKNYLIPALQNWNQKAIELYNSAHQFYLNQNLENLNLWQTKFKEFYQQTALIELFYFGPANDSRNLFLNINSFPFEKESCLSNLHCSYSVVQILNETTTINRNYLQNLGIRLKGLSVLEYLIFTDGGYVFSENQNPDSVLNSLTGRKLQFAYFLTEDIYMNVKTIYEDWNQNFLNIITNPNLGNSYYRSHLDVFSELNVSIIDQLSRIIDKKIGFPAGFSVSSGGSIHLDKIESPYANLSAVSVYQNLLSIYEVYNGDDRMRYGLRHLIERTQPEASNFYKQILKEILMDFKNQRDLKNLIQNDLNNLYIQFNKIKELRIFFSSDFVSLTGTNPGVGSSDGD